MSQNLRSTCSEPFFFMNSKNSLGVIVRSFPESRSWLGAQRDLARLHRKRASLSATGFAARAKALFSRPRTLEGPFSNGVRNGCAERRMGQVAWHRRLARQWAALPARSILRFKPRCQRWTGHRAVNRVKAELGT